MSKYLQIKMQKALDESQDENIDGLRQQVVGESIGHLKSKISKVETEGGYQPHLEKVEHTPNYQGTDLAEVAIDVYKSNINPPKHKEGYHSEEQPITPALRHHYKAVARSLAGMRNGGDGGRLRQDAGPNGGDMRVGDGRVIHTEEVSVADMSIEEYEAYINEGYKDLPKRKMGMKAGKKTISALGHALKTGTDGVGSIESQKRTQQADKKAKQADKIHNVAKRHNPTKSKLKNIQNTLKGMTKEEVIYEGDAVKDLEDKLLEMTDHSWQSIDKVMRGIAKEYDITPKELHNDFKKAHNGQIPDDWIKENVKVEECGWFPLEEAIVNRIGKTYDVSLIWKGHTRRLKFFWPVMGIPTRDDMQRAVELFYPKGRLLAFYPTQQDNNDFMVVVPPMTESYDIIYENEWVQLPENYNELMVHIEYVEGEIVSTPEIDENGVVSFLISDHETGEEMVVSLSEDDMKGMSVSSGHKRSTESGAGMTSKGVAAYRRRNPGSELKTAVTGKVKPGSKAANRRKSFCARSRGWDGERGKAARRRWRC